MLIDELAKASALFPTGCVGVVLHPEAYARCVRELCESREWDTRWSRRERALIVDLPNQRLRIVPQEE